MKISQVLRKAAKDMNNSTYTIGCCNAITINAITNKESCDTLNYFKNLFEPLWEKDEDFHQRDYNYWMVEKDEFLPNTNYFVSLIIKRKVKNRRILALLLAAEVAESEGL